ncbi:MAG: hypothetical protein HY871_04575 [Chloroflexi bacterium]|nr:hypothetical protein [Chloroflexota bacterium]
MKKAVLVALCVSLLGFTAAGAWAVSSGQYKIDWSVASSGGGALTASTHALNGTVGQAAIGSLRSNSYVLSPGFWAGASQQTGGMQKIFLPLILKNRN